MTTITVTISVRNTTVVVNRMRVHIGYKFFMINVCATQYYWYIEEMSRRNNVWCILYKIYMFVLEHFPFLFSIVSERTIVYPKQNRNTFFFAAQSKITKNTRILRNTRTYVMHTHVTHAVYA